MKNRGCIVAVAVAVGLLVIALAVGGWFVGKYNTMVELRSGTATVKGYAAHEEKTLTEVVEARAKATQANIDASSLTPEALEKFQAAQGQLSQALGRLMVVAERYPDLKANTNFLELQSQLEGTENRIAVARQRFNEAASKYNAYIMKFPGNIIAGITGFKEAALFKADQGASEAPKVEF